MERVLSLFLSFSLPLPPLPLEVGPLNYFPFSEEGLFSLLLSPSPFFLPSPSLFPPLPPLPLEVGFLKSREGVWGHCELPQRNGIWCILASKYDIWCQQF